MLQFKYFSPLKTFKTSTLVPRACSSNPSRIMRHLLPKVSKIYFSRFSVTPNPLMKGFCCTMTFSTASPGFTSFRNTKKTMEKVVNSFFAQSQAIFLHNVVLPIPGSPLMTIFRGFWDTSVLWDFPTDVPTSVVNCSLNSKQIGRMVGIVAWVHRDI